MGFGLPQFFIPIWLQFYEGAIITTTAKVINQDIFQIHWWELEVSRLKQDREVLAVDLRCYLTALTFWLVEAISFSKDLCNHKNC